MKVRRQKPIPDVKVSLKGKEVRKLLNEIDKLADLVRYNPELETPILDELTCQLEDIVSDFF